VTRSHRKNRAVLAGFFVIVLVIAIADHPIETAQASLDRGQLLEDLRRLSADEMEGREMGTAGGARARAYVVERFRAVGLQPLNGRLEWPVALSRPVASVETASAAANVIGLLRGARHADRYLVISAHYDHIGVRRGEVFNGADDNASGTAALFAIAAHFAKSPANLSLLFVAFDGEEQGMLGSRTFVAASPVPHGAMLLNLNLDMIARDPNHELWVAGVRQQPLLRAIVEKVAASAPVTLRTGYDDPAVPRDDWTRQSDQWSFIQAGIPALYVGVADERHHHRSSDDFENITPDFYVNAVRTIVQLIDALDASPALETLSRGDTAGRQIR
jgi:Zn-dependent M28 family amino/carboxypeptidase